MGGLVYQILLKLRNLATNNTAVTSPGHFPLKFNQSYSNLLGNSRLDIHLSFSCNSYETCRLFPFNKY